MALPPLSGGAAKVTVASVSPATATTLIGAPGTVAGVTLFDGNEGRPVPFALVARTVKV